MLIIKLFLLSLSPTLFFYEPQNQAEKSGVLVPVIIYKGEKMDYAVLPEIVLYPKYAHPKPKKFNYARHAVYSCYPYLKTLLATLRELHDSNTLTSNSMRRKFIRTKEKELRQQFSERVRNMTIYEGKVLLKLLYRETNKTGYALIKETRGGFMAGIYQGVAKLFGGSLKYEYNPEHNDEDKEIEEAYLEAQVAYGF